MIGLITKASAAKTVIKKGAETYKNLPENQKRAVDLGGVIAVGSAIFFGYKFLSPLFKGFNFVTGKKFEEDKKTVEAENTKLTDRELNKLSISPTLTKNEAKSLAGAFLQAFLNNQPDWSKNLWDEGTDEDAVYETLKQLKNKADWLLVSQMYGAPRAKTLSQELYYELTVKEMKKVREILKQIKVTV